MPYEDKYKFPNKIRQKIRKDADYRCQLCDTETHGEVHHILSVGFFKRFCQDHARTLITHIANGTLLCHSCHMKLHEEQREWDHEKRATYAHAMREYLVSELAENM